MDRKQGVKPVADGKPVAAACGKVKVLEKPLPVRLEAHLAGRSWEGPILDPANPNLRQRD